MSKFLLCCNAAVKLFFLLFSLPTATNKFDTPYYYVVLVYCKFIMLPESGAFI